MADDLPILDLGFARLDTERGLRQGVPEAVLAEGKRPEQVAAIVAGLVERGTETVIVTRADEAARAAALAAVDGIEEDAEARMVWLRRAVPEAVGTVAIVSAGTSDGAVVREVQRTCELLGTNATVQEDVGVAGLHRLAVALPDLRAADCVVVAAGQDAALASVVGGLVATPVIAVPTSVGYGASFGGLAALLGMLNSCAAGVTVVNIDNGFGAAVAASRICRG
jgi:pyridinium-3,5-biscarboxylic acid mononucleotide synthase